MLVLGLLLLAGGIGVLAYFGGELLRVLRERRHRRRARRAGAARRAGRAGRRGRVRARHTGAPGAG